MPAALWMVRSRRPSAHSSCCLASTAPTRRRADSRLGKIAHHVPLRGPALPVGHWEGREGQDVRRGVRQQLGHLGKRLPELFHKWRLRAAPDLPSCSDADQTIVPARPSLSVPLPYHPRSVDSGFSGLCHAHPFQNFPNLALQGLENVADVSAGVYSCEVVLISQCAELVKQGALVTDEVVVQIWSTQKVLARLPMVQLSHRQHARQQSLNVHV